MRSKPIFVNYIMVKISKNLKKQPWGSHYFLSSHKASVSGYFMVKLTHGHKYGNSSIKEQLCSSWGGSIFKAEKGCLNNKNSKLELRNIIQMFHWVPKLVFIKWRWNEVNKDTTKIVDFIARCQQIKSWKVPRPRVIATWLMNNPYWLPYSGITEVTGA